MNIREFHNSNINSDNIAVLVASRGGNGSMPGEPLLWTEEGEYGEIFVGDSNHTPSVDVGDLDAAAVVSEWLAGVGDADSVDVDRDVGHVRTTGITKITITPATVEDVNGDKHDGAIIEAGDLRIEALPPHPGGPDVWLGSDWAKLPREAISLIYDVMNDTREGVLERDDYGDW